MIYQCHGHTLLKDFVAGFVIAIDYQRIGKILYFTDWLNIIIVLLF